MPEGSATWLEYRAREARMYKRAFRAIAATFRSDSASIDSMLMFRAEEHMFSPTEKNVILADRDYLHIDTLYLDIHEMLHLPRAQHPVYSVCFSRIINDTVLLAHVIEEKERENSMRWQEFLMASVSCLTRKAE